MYDCLKMRIVARIDAICSVLLKLGYVRSDSLVRERYLKFENEWSNIG